MSEFLLTGRNSSTNKKSVLNIDDNGKLKLDESGKITNIETNISTTNTKLDTVNTNLTSIDGLLTTIDSDTNDIKTSTTTSTNSLTALETDLVDRRINLQYQRSLGNCYMVSDETRLTAGTNAFFSILNPTASGKTMYVYSISFSIGDNAGVDVGGVVLLESFAEADYTIGSAANDGKNLKIGQSDSSMEGGRNSTITTRTPLIRESFSFSTATTQELFQFTRDMSKDMIEVPASYGLCFSYQDDTATALELDYSLNFRFVLL